MGEVTDQVTTATIAATPKSTAPTTSRSISGFALPSVIHNNQSLRKVSYFWNFRHCIVRYYWYAFLFIFIYISKVLICIQKCIFIYTYFRRHRSIERERYIYIYIYTYHIHNVSVYVYMYFYIHIHIHIHIQSYTYTYTYTYTHTYTDTYVYIYIYIYMRVFVGQHGCPNQCIFETFTFSFAGTFEQIMCKVCHACIRPSDAFYVDSLKPRMSSRRTHLGKPLLWLFLTWQRPCPHGFTWPCNEVAKIWNSSWTENLVAGQLFRQS